MTVAEILKASGMTDEQISTLDAKVTEGFTKVLSTAAQEREQAELVRRAQAEQYDTQIAPALDNWANEKAAKDAELAFYKAQLEGAKEGGFKVTAPPGTPNPTPGSPARTQDGKFVAGGNPVPGSPQLEQKLTAEIGSAFSFLADTTWKYRTLFGKEIPDSPTALISEAVSQHMKPADWAEKKYGFKAKEAEMAASARKAEIDAAVKDAEARKDKEWGERAGSNPDMRRAETSRFSEINKAVKAGQRPDPIRPGISESERDAGTRAAIRAEVATQTVQ